jgi:hypothetical protein
LKRLLNSDLGMTNRSRLTAALSVPAIRLRTLVRSRTAALSAILSISLLGISAPITANATVLPKCSTSQGPPCLFGAGNFEVDGNIPVDNGGHDWADLGTAANPGSTLATICDRPSGQTDDSFTQGSKENDVNPTTAFGSIPGNKDDLSSAQVGTQVINGVAYLYLDWTRLNSLGTATIDYEFNQSQALTANGVTHQRTQGDLLITYDYRGGNAAGISYRTWNATLGTWSDPIDLTLTGNAAGTINLTNDVIDPCTGQTLGPLRFGEAAINLTAIYQALGSNCEFFGSVLVKSRAAIAFTSELKDFIQPAPVNLSNCASPTIATTANPQSGNIGVAGTYGDTATLSNGNSPTGNVSFNLYGPFTPGSTPAADACVALGQQGSNAVFQANLTQAISNGLASVSTSWTPAAGGDFYWVATYAGDALNNAFGPSGCGEPAEKVHILAQPGIGTTPSAGGTIGTVINDTASVTGGSSPTGTVTFNLYAPGDTTCVSAIQTFANVTLSGLTATSGNYTTAAVGTYRWTATYNGDANNLTATSGCQDEKVTVGSAEQVAAAAAQQVAAAAAQQVLAAAVTLPKAGAGPQQQVGSAAGGGGPSGAVGIMATLLLALVGGLLFTFRRRQGSETAGAEA